MDNIYSYSNIKSPCLNCTSRVVGCHAHCTSYTDYKLDLMKSKSSISKQEQEATNYRMDRHRKVNNK